MSKNKLTTDDQFFLLQNVYLILDKIHQIKSVEHKILCSNNLLDFILHLE